jgi:phage shock protein E
MLRSRFLFPLWMACALPAAAQDAASLVNPAIDMAAYLRTANQAAAHRAAHRVSEDDFIRLSSMPGTVILDARSTERYNQLHVRGAVNLPFPDIAITTLQRMLPDHETRILIYCNNNFLNAGDAFMSKLPSASLNLSTYIALYDYGYRNIYELGPLIDIRATRIAFDASANRSP